MLEHEIIKLLDRCSNAYARGEQYILKQSDVDNLGEFTVGTPVTDSVYDHLYYKYRKMFPTNQFFYKVGKSDAGYGSEVNLSVWPAGSMEEIKEGDLNKWKTPNYYAISAKLDGCSLILFYKNGYLDVASTRGDGIKGFDVTRHILKCKNFHDQLFDSNESLIVRGELIIPKDKWPLCKQELEEKTGKSFANARNTVAGFLNAKDTNEIIAKYVEFLAYGIKYSTTSEPDEEQKFVDLQELGFTIPKVWYYNSDEFDEAVLQNLIQQLKANYNYECDGVILTVNDSTKLPGYETNTLNPRRSRKYKVGMADEAKETTVINVRWQISKDAMFKPVVEIEPIQLDGATVSNVTANNYETVNTLGIGPGARIKVKRSGMVIPYLEEVITPAEPSKPDYPFKISGPEAVYTGNDETMLREIYLQKLIFSTKALEIDQAAEGNLRKIVNEYYNITEDLPGSTYMNLLDLILMDEDTIVSIIGKNGKKLYKSLHDRVSSITEPELFDALGTFGRGIGKTKLQKIFDVYGHLAPSYQELMALEGFSDITAQQIIAFESEYKRTKELLSTIDQVKLVEKIKPVLKSDKYKDYIVCFTGVRSDALCRIINENGGIATENWNKKVNLLVAKDPSSNSGKAKKAREAGIQIISLQEAEQLFVD